MAARNFDRDSTVDQVLAGIDLKGKHAVITGASGGLGEESARGLAAAGASVTLVARNVAKAQKVAEAIRARHPSAGAVDVMEAELADLPSIRRFGEAWQASGQRIDILLLNAGIMACPLERTKEGWEMQFATNHLGHFLLASFLAPSLTPTSRVVVVSSDAHRFAPVDLEDLHFQRREYTPWTAYGQSKTANALFALALDERLKSRGVRAFSLHPGMIPTELGRHMDKESMKDMQRLSKRLQQEEPTQDKAAMKRKMAMKTVESGAATQLWAATAPELAGTGGLYCDDCQVGSPRDWAMDLAVAQKLWEASEQILGIKFPAQAESKL